MKTTEVLYRLALCRIRGIGPVRFKKIIEQVDDTSFLFSTTKKILRKDFELTEQVASDILSFHQFESVQQEMLILEKHGIEILFHDDPRYPKRLVLCTDSPSVLFFKGNLEALEKPMVSIIGTRHHTEYGRALCAEVVQELSKYPCCIVSGLAFGIDITAHKSALQFQVPTIGVLAHGLQEVYPLPHARVATDMQVRGGLLTEFLWNTRPARENFPTRNRIVAGMSEATIIIETGARGGSMITAEMAYSYNRDVLCFPGRTTDIRSAGCNNLIKQMKAQLVTQPSDIIQALGWNKPLPKPRQRQLFIELTEEERRVLDTLNSSEGMHIDDLLQQSELSASKLSNAMLSLEMQGLLRVKPGKMVIMV